MSKLIEGFFSFDLKDKVSFVLWAFIFLLYPFYNITCQGVPVYLYMVALFSLVSFIVYTKALKKSIKLKPLIILTVFCIWTFIINVYYGVRLSEPAFFKIILRFIGITLFSWACFIAIKSRWNTYFNLMFYSSCVAFMIIFCVFLIQGELHRNEVFFRNINQFARYALLIGVLLGLKYYNEPNSNKKYIYLALLAIVNFLVLFSMSRACIAGLVTLDMVLLPKMWKETLLSVILGLGLLFSYNYYHGSIEKYTGYIEYRLNENGEEDRVYNRGYTRFLEYPEYIFLGAGEALNERFETKNGFHSSYGSILWAYGLVGFILLFTYHSFCFRIVDYSILFLVPLIINSIVHNDIRFIYIWILPILFYYKGVSHLNSKESFFQLF